MNNRKPCRVRGCQNWHHHDFPMCSIHMADVPPDQRAAYWLDPSREAADALLAHVNGGQAPARRRAPSNDDVGTRRTFMQEAALALREARDEAEAARLSHDDDDGA